jgi:hypothetical protein
MLGRIHERKFYFLIASMQEQGSRTAVLPVHQKHHNLAIAIPGAVVRTIAFKVIRCDPRRLEIEGAHDLQARAAQTAGDAGYRLVVTS